MALLFKQRLKDVIFLFKRIFFIFLSVVVLVSSAAYATTIPELPGENGVLLQYSNGSYYFMEASGVLADYQLCITDDNFLVITNRYSVNNGTFTFYKLVDGIWEYQGVYDSLSWFDSYTVLWSSANINDTDGSVFFQQADSLIPTPAPEVLPGIQQIQIVPQALTQNLPMLIQVGLIALAVLFGTRLVPRLIHLFLQ